MTSSAKRNVDKPSADGGPMPTADRPRAEKLLALVDEIAGMTPRRPQTDSVELLRETREER